MIKTQNDKANDTQDFINNLRFTYLKEIHDLRG